MVAVRAWLSGTVPLGLRGLGGPRFDVADFAAVTSAAAELCAGDGRPLAVSLVPAMLTALESAGAIGLEALARYDVVLVGGAALAEGLDSRLRAAGIRIRASYGMTETCGGAVLDGLALTGTKVTTGPDGRLRIAGPQVALGYRQGGEPEDWAVVSPGVRAFRTADLGEVSRDGRVAVHGRADDVLKVGGAAVSPAAVERVILRDTRVRAAAVVPVAVPDRGARLVAFVVLAAGVAGPPAEIADLVEGALGRAARPSRVLTVPELPLLPSGKPDREALISGNAVAGSALPRPGARG
jgi:O-succinylbenzoic acid--CoA ligase